LVLRVCACKDDASVTALAAAMVDGAGDGGDEVTVGMVAVLQSLVAAAVARLQDGAAASGVEGEEGVGAKETAPPPPGLLAAVVAYRAMYEDALDRIVTLLHAS
jgi:hypothetical protein